MATYGGGATSVNWLYVSATLEDIRRMNKESCIVVAAGGGAGSFKGDNNYYGGSGGGYQGGNPRVGDIEIPNCAGTQYTGYKGGKGEPGHGNIGGGGGGFWGGLIGNAALVIPEIYNIEKSGNSVTVHYAIPSGASSIRLVYKKNSKPTSRSDGTYISITQSSTEQTVTGLDLGSIYYFTIFTSTSKSESKSVELLSLVSLWDIVLDDDIAHGTWCGSGASSAQLATDKILVWGESDRRPTLSNGVLSYTPPRDYAYTVTSFPLKDTYTIAGGYTKVNFVSKSPDAYHDQWILAGVGDGTGTWQNQILSLSAYTYKQNYYSEFNPVHVDAVGIYEDEKILGSSVSTRRIDIVFQYGTWEMQEIKLRLA